MLPGRDVLAARGDDQVLLAVGDAQVAVLRRTRRRRRSAASRRPASPRWPRGCAGSRGTRRRRAPRSRRPRRCAPRCRGRPRRRCRHASDRDGSGVVTPVFSLWPYTSQISRPIDRKKRSTSGSIGAAPLARMRTSSNPSAARSLLSTSRSARRWRRSSPGGIGSPRSRRSDTRRPVRIAQRASARCGRRAGVDLLVDLGRHLLPHARHAEEVGGPHLAQAHARGWASRRGTRWRCRTGRSGTR